MECGILTSMQIGIDPARQNRKIVGLLAGSHELENCKDEVSWLEVLW